MAESANVIPLKPRRTPAKPEPTEPLWREVLGVDEVGLDDNFFSLGGHSLLAAKVVGRIRASLNVAVPIPLLFRQPTIRRISEFIDNNVWAASQGDRTDSAIETDTEEVIL